MTRLYDYTVEVRRVEQNSDGAKTTHWDRREVAGASNLAEVKERLRVKNMDNIRYVTKTITDESCPGCGRSDPGHNPAGCQQVNDLDYLPAEPFWNEPEHTRTQRPKTRDQLLPDDPRAHHPRGTAKGEGEPERRPATAGDRLH